MRFLPGKPNPRYAAVAHGLWDARDLLVYCSGNNLIIMGDNGTHLLQTAYLPTDGNAVAICTDSGSIAIGHGCETSVFCAHKSFGQKTTWALERTLTLGGPVTALAFGSNELLCASENILQLYALGDHNRMVWSQTLPNRVDECTFSSDSIMFTSHGKGDRLLKLWTRSSFDTNNLSFDLQYIAHPAPIVFARWRSQHQMLESTALYTLAEDGVLRLWSQLPCGEYRLSASLYCGHCCYPFVLNVNQTTDWAFLLRHGSRLSVVELSNIECSSLVRVRETVRERKFHIVNDVEVLNTPHDRRVVCQSLPSGAKKVQIITTLLGEAISVATASMDDVFKVSMQSYLAGHFKSIRRITRSGCGDRLLTQTRFSENILWKQLMLDNGSKTLVKQAEIDTGTDGAVLAAEVHENLVYTLVKSKLVVWDSHEYPAKVLASIPMPNAVEALCLFLLPSAIPCIVVLFPENVLAYTLTDSNELRQLSSDRLSGLDGEKVLGASVVDPVGWKEMVGKVPDVDARAVLKTLSDKSTIQLWTAGFDGERVLWLPTASFSTHEVLGVGASELQKYEVSSTRLLAVATRDRFVIWDSKYGVVEFDKPLPDISDLDWTTSPTGECFLGVGYGFHVVIYCQQRYNYTKNLQAWVPIRELDISQYTTHAIGDSIWLKDGTFVIGSGNELFIQGATVDMKEQKVRQLLQDRNTVSALETATSIYDIGVILSGPLPLYHPQMIIQLLLDDKLKTAEKILTRLLHSLKYATVIEPYMIAEVESHLGFDIASVVEPENDALVSPEFVEVAEGLNTVLQKVSLIYLTRNQQITLLGVIEALGALAKDAASVDSAGFKFVLGLWLYRVHSSTGAKMMYRDFVWAAISDTKASLLDLAFKDHPKKTWGLMRQFGLAIWLERPTLIEQVEDLVRQLYAENRDPVEVSLFYIALRKKSVLFNLWRITGSHPEQAKTMKLLSNDFSQTKYKTVAMKNAYALMSKHRYEYAAALFLLADAPNDACNVLAKQLNDLQLAITVARIYDGDHGPCMCYIAERFIGKPKSPGAFDERWLAAWAHHQTADAEQTVKVIVEFCWMPNTPEDPVLLKLYSTLRSKYRLSVGEEMALLRKVANTYSHMGCDIIGMCLLRDWQFIREVSEPEPEKEKEEEEYPAPPANLVAPPEIPMEPDMSAFDFGF